MIAKLALAALLIVVITLAILSFFLHLREESICVERGLETTTVHGTTLCMDRDRRLIKP